MHKRMRIVCLGFALFPGCIAAGDDSDLGSFDVPGDVIHDVGEASEATDAEPDSPISTETASDAVSDATDDVPDAVPDVWQAACGPEDFPGPHEPDYDNACTGNIGCKVMPCLACTSSCSLCDGPRCVGVIHDDSCLTPPGQILEWADEPSGGIASISPDAVLAISHPEPQTVVLTLDATEIVPEHARWRDVAGTDLTRPLALPVERVADRLLVAGTWSMRNWCTGQVVSGSVEPQVVDATIENNQRASATLPFSEGAPWTGNLAWIRAYRDAEGTLVFVWFEPAQAIVFGYNNIDSAAALVSGPIPEDAAQPLGPEGTGFDWVSALKAAISASTN